MKVLVTGAFGRLGQRCIAQLMLKGYDIVAFDIDNKNNRKVERQLLKGYESKIRVVWADICQSSDVEKAVKGVDAVIHLAAILPPLTDTHGEFAEKINVGGTKNIIKAIEACDVKPLLVFSSSVSVYGDKQNLPAPRLADETLQASDNYTSHKIACEALVKELKYFVIVRVGASVAAELQASDFGMLKQMFEVKASNRLEYVHPDDVARALANIVGNPACISKVLLLGGGESCQVFQRDMINAGMQGLGISFDDTDFGEEAFYTDWMDTEESQRLLDYQRVSFEDYRLAMADKMKVIRFFVKPIAPMMKFIIKLWLK